MKRLLIILLISISTFSFGKYVKIQTPYGEKEVFVPDNKDELEKLYLNAVKKYMEERFALEGVLQKWKTAVLLSEDLAKANASLIKDFEKYMKSPKWPQSIQHFIKFGSGYNFELEKFQASVGYQALVFNRFILGLDLNAPLAFYFNFGFKL